MAKDIKDLEEGFQELQKYSDTQYVTIANLQEEIARLRSENESLKTMLEQNLPSIGFEKSDLSLGISNEQLICETQLLNLKNSACSRDLTMEEVRKVEILTNVLAKVKKNNPDAEEVTVKEMTPDQLLSIVNGK